jgi:hypothetical protein
VDGAVIVPSKTKAQHNFMAAVANNPAFAKKAGVPQSVGTDFTKADKGRKFGKGGEMAKKPMFGGKETYSEELREAKAIKSGKISPQQYAKGEKSEEAKMGKKKFADGGMPMMPPTAPAARGRPGMGAPAGGRGLSPQALAALMARKGAPAARKPAGMGMAPRPAAPAMMAKGGFTKSADGVAKKGKTEATQVKMTRGGKC